MSIKRKITYSQAISEAMTQAMQKDKEVFVFGLGVRDCKGIFCTTLDIANKYKSLRVMETPASESALTGIAVGAAATGKKPVLVHARNDFMFLSLDQMANIASKWKYSYAGKSSLTFLMRGIIGKGWGQGPTHSQSLQSVFAHFPGLYVLMPSNAYDAKGLILSALKKKVPCVCFEHRRLYNSLSEVPRGAYDIEFGKARIVRSAKDITCVATSLMVEEAVKAHMALQKMGIGLEVIDPRTLKPLDKKAIIRSVKKTRRLIVADTGWVECGFSAEVAALIAEEIPKSLKAPVKRMGLTPCPAPVSQPLECAYYPNHKDIFTQSCRLMNKKPDLKLIQDPILDNFKGPY